VEAHEHEHGPADLAEQPDPVAKDVTDQSDRCPQCDETIEKPTTNASAWRRAMSRRPGAPSGVVPTM
jgi:hypothetical protein